METTWEGELAHVDSAYHLGMSSLRPIDLHTHPNTHK